MTVLDGKNTAKQIRAEMAQRVLQLQDEGLRPPHLAIVIVGHDAASETYVANKVKACEQVGFMTTKVALEASVTQEELLERIESLNNDDSIDGFIVQLP